MKKVLVVLLLAITFATSTFSEGAYAATASPVSVTLSSGERNDSTSRIYLLNSDMLGVSISNYWYSDHEINYTIFKDGSAWVSGVVGVNSSKSFNLDTAGAGGYSMRLYCGQYKDKTGCEASGQLSDK